MATNSSPYDFYTQKIKPDGSPNSKLSKIDLFNTVYPDSADVELDFNADSECYSSVLCVESESNPTGYDYSQPFGINHPAWSDSRCSCNHYPQTGCNRVTAFRKGDPSLVSGVVGTPFPIFPDPAFPASWSDQYIYSHTFASGTSDSSVSLNIGANIDLNFVLTGSSATTSKCSEDSTTINSQEVIRKYYLVTGLKNHDQSVEDLYTEGYDVYSEDWGHCGVVRQYWTDSPKLNKPWPSIERAIPVIAYVVDSPSEPDPESDPEPDPELDPNYDYTDRELGCTSPYSYRGDSIDRGQACAHYISSGISRYTDCPDGYTYSAGGLGAAASCRNFVSAEYQSCPSGSEVDPFNSSQCRTAKVTADPPADDPPSNEPPSWCAGTGDVWNSSTGVCSYGTPPITTCAEGTVWNSSTSQCEQTNTVGDGVGVTNPPPWCTASTLVWDSSTSTCRSTDGGGLVTQGPSDNPDSNLVSFGDAPVAGNSTGTRDISGFGFYDSIYGADTTLSSFVETEMAKWNTVTLKTRLLTFIPPSGIGALPRKCFALSISTQEFCIDLNSYAFAFDALRALLYILSGWTAFRIVIGA